MSSIGSKDQYSSTARLTEKEVTSIRSFIDEGYYSSISGFVFDALRDITAEIVEQVSKLFTIASTTHPLEEAEKLTQSAIQSIFIDKDDRKASVEKPTQLVNITGVRTYIEQSIELLKQYLGLQDLQDVITFVVDEQIKKIEMCITGTIVIKELREEIAKKKSDNSQGDEIQELIKKAGIKRKR